MPVFVFCTYLFIYFLERILCLLTSWPSVTTAATGPFLMMAMQNGWGKSKYPKLYPQRCLIIAIHLSLWFFPYSCFMLMWIRTHRWWVSLRSLLWLATSASFPRAGMAACVCEPRSWPVSYQVSVTHMVIVFLTIVHLYMWLSDLRLLNC